MRNVPQHQPRRDPRYSSLHAFPDVVWLPLPVAGHGRKLNVVNNEKLRYIFKSCNFSSTTIAPSLLRQGRFLFSCVWTFSVIRNFFLSKVEIERTKWYFKGRTCRFHRWAPLWYFAFQVWPKMGGGIIITYQRRGKKFGTFLHVAFFHLGIGGLLPTKHTHDRPVFSSPSVGYRRQWQALFDLLLKFLRVQQRKSNMLKSVWGTEVLVFEALSVRSFCAVLGQQIVLSQGYLRSTGHHTQFCDSINPLAKTATTATGVK